MKLTYLALATTCLSLIGCEATMDDALLEPQFEVVAQAKHGLAQPTDLAFHRERLDELWVVNRREDSTTLLFNASNPDTREIETLVDPYALHFMDRVSSIAFGPDGLFGTCQDSTNTYNGATGGDNFMGPALWSSDLDYYAKSNPEAVAFLSDQFGMPVDLGSHLDMLHESPLCMGIDWDKRNVYWVFDGWDGAIVRYDFAEDHGHGFDDHSDGIISRYVSGQVARVKGVMSHVALDRDTGLLYIADTGNSRIAVLDTKAGERGDNLRATEPGTDHHEMVGVDLTTLVEDLKEPSGIELIDGHLVVTEHGTGLIHIFSLDGATISVIDTGLGDGHLAGITGATIDDLWFVDQKDDTVTHMTMGL